MRDWKAYWARVFKIIVFFLLICHSLPTGDALTPTKWSLDADLLVSRNCSRNVRPNHGGPPVEVGVSMYILDISSISEETMDYQLDLYFRQYWTDKCLLPINKSFALSIDNVPVIWTPDTFFVNEKNSYLRQKSPSNEVFLVDKSGLITYSKRVTMTATCRLNLRYFPMDQQQCQLDIESYGHTTEDIKYKWNFGQESVGVSNDILLPQFKILKPQDLETEISEKYSRLRVKFQFQRFIGHHLLHVFLPSALIVLMSFISIWINYKHTPIRIALSTLAFFTMVVFASNINATLPKVSYVTAMDIYMFGCLAIICCSLLEIIISSYINIKIERKISMLNFIKKKRNEQLVENSGKNIEKSEYCGKGFYDMDDDDSTNKMDIYSKVLFPIMFITFNLIFWIYYCSF